MKIKLHLINVIPSGVENGAAREPRHGREARGLSEREVSGSNSVAQLTAKFAGYLDFARYDGWALQLNCTSHVGRRRDDRLQFLHSPDDHIGIFRTISSDGANDPAAFRDFPGNDVLLG